MYINRWLNVKMSGARVKTEDIICLDSDTDMNNNEEVVTTGAGEMRLVGNNADGWSVKGSQESTITEEFANRLSSLQKTADEMLAKGNLKYRVLQQKYNELSSRCECLERQHQDLSVKYEDLNREYARVSQLSQSSANSLTSPRPESQRAASGDDRQRKLDLAVKHENNAKQVTRYLFELLMSERKQHIFHCQEYDKMLTDRYIASAEWFVNDWPQTITYVTDKDQREVTFKGPDIESRYALPNVTGKTYLYNIYRQVNEQLALMGKNPEDYAIQFVHRVTIDDTLRTVGYGKTLIHLTAGDVLPAGKVVLSVIPKALKPTNGAVVALPVGREYHPTREDPPILRQRLDDYIRKTGDRVSYNKIVPIIAGPCNHDETRLLGLVDSIAKYIRQTLPELNTNPGPAVPPTQPPVLPINMNPHMMSRLSYGQTRPASAAAGSADAHTEGPPVKRQLTTAERMARLQNEMTELQRQISLSERKPVEPPPKN